jgi:hypothetical protein
MSDTIWHTIARLRRAQPRNGDTMEVCARLELALHTIQQLDDMARGRAPEPRPYFDKKAYMREYMRRRRAKAKARKTD